MGDRMRSAFPYAAVVVSLVCAIAGIHDINVLFPSLLAFVGWMACIDLLRRDH